MPCSSLVVNGTEATKDGVANYPVINATYDIKICNYNDVMMSFAPTKVDNVTGEEEFRTYLQFWYTEPVPNAMDSFTKQYIIDKKFTPSIHGSLAAGSCQEGSGKVELQTSQLKHYMQASIQGPLSTNATFDDRFCYAYAFRPIEFEYEYGDPTCEMSVSIHHI
jgi:hypothetical protein